MSPTKIEWTDETWNPTTGCDRVSEGCDHCYALTLAKRLKAMGNSRYQRDGDPRRSGPGFGLTLHPDQLELPLRWKKPRLVFVDSMSDLFHDEVPDEFIANVWAVMAITPQHTYQVLTKRPGRMASLINRWSGILPGGRRVDPPWPLPNVWLGTSVENQKWADVRIPKLLATPAAVRFLSCEPLLGPIDLSGWLSMWTCPCGQFQRMDHTGCLWCGRRQRVVFPGLGWVIVGGESGPGARPMDVDWLRSIVEQCHAGGVPLFVKQDSGRRSGQQGRIPDELWRRKEWPGGR